MKYFLALEINRKSKKGDNSDKYYPLKWEKIVDFKDINTFDLKSINDFTMQFEDYQDLFKFLIDNRLVYYSYYGKRFVIVYKLNNKYYSLDYGIPYKEDNKYFIDELNIIFYLKVQRKNIEFLSKLCRKLHSSLPYNSDKYMRHPYYEPLMALENYIAKLKKGFEDEEAFDLNINLLFSRICYKYDYEKQETKTNYGEPVINYRKFRDLIMFIKCYEESKTRPIAKEEKPLIRDLVKRHEIDDKIIKGDQTSLFN